MDYRSMTLVDGVEGERLPVIEDTARQRKQHNDTSEPEKKPPSKWKLLEAVVDIERDKIDKRKWNEANKDAIKRIKRSYKCACKTFNALPMTHFSKQLGCKAISMKGYGLGDAGTKALCVALLNDYILTNLDLSGNILGDKELQYIKQLLEVNVYISTLDLSDNNFTTEGARTLGKMFSKHNSVNRLNLSGNDFQDKDAKYISLIIRYNTDLIRLDLSHNNFMESGGVFLGHALGHNDSLEELDLSWNHLRGKGAAAIGNGLKTNKSVTSLSLGYNGFGNEGSTAISHALKENKTLTELDLTNNRIHPPAAFVLFEGLIRNSKLEVLNLSRNPLTPVTTTYAISKLKESGVSQLAHLDLSGMVVSTEFEETVKEIKELRQFEAIYDSSMHLRGQLDVNSFMKKGNNKNSNLGFKSPTRVFNVEPAKILYSLKDRMSRSVDFFNNLDADGSQTISREEFRKGMERMNFNMSKSALDELIDYLDADGDGEIDILEFIEGERRMKRIQALNKEKQRKKEALKLPTISGKQTPNQTPSLTQLKENLQDTAENGEREEAPPVFKRKMSMKEFYNFGTKYEPLPQLPGRNLTSRDQTRGVSRGSNTGASKPASRIGKRSLIRE
ncbi:unnamed protein product [Owenia fusiformis]|uniref:Uncharacterized protein n=1 Tax=Owenia fusiformis TaxID=6347 RepID=A0A8J1TI78_OWEFU|nr:unnamed protein product [Owenia fusiformis]